MESIPLTTGDAHELPADVAEATGVAVGGAVVCHPQPQHGNNRFNPVVEAVFRHFPTVDWSVLRFDFRAEFDRGVVERHDVVAALHALGDHVDSGSRSARSWL